MRKRMAREIKMLGTTELLDEDNHEFVCSHAEMCDLAF